MTNNTRSIVFCFIAQDNTGIVEKLSNTVKSHQGNWLESRLVTMGGLFSGLVNISVSTDNITALKDSLDALSSQGIDIVRFEDTEQNEQTKTYAHLELVGPDRAGIVHELTRTLALHSINIETMSTEVVSAAMSAEPLFKATVEYSLSNDLSEDAFYSAIDEVADELTLDISFTS